MCITTFEGLDGGSDHGRARAARPTPTPTRTTARRRVEAGRLTNTPDIATTPRPDSTTSGPDTTRRCWGALCRAILLASVADSISTHMWGMIRSIWWTRRGRRRMDRRGIPLRCLKQYRHFLALDRSPSWPRRRSKWGPNSRVSGPQRRRFTKTNQMHIFRAMRQGTIPPGPISATNFLLMPLRHQGGQTKGCV